jgi:hypothetical protein
LKSTSLQDQPENMRRLAEIKAKYDPTNFFRLNNNMAPAS